VIKQNAIRTPDGTFLNSSHRHDYQTHTDTVSGEKYMVDGGLDYYRGTFNNVKPESFHLNGDEPFEILRDKFLWGSYGIFGDEPLKWNILSEMDESHIKALIRLFKESSMSNSERLNLFIKELQYRDDNDLLRKR